MTPPVKRWPCPTHGELEWRGTVECTCGRLYRFVLKEGTADQFDVVSAYGEVLPGLVQECSCGNRFMPGNIKPACERCFEERGDIMRKQAN